MFWRTVFIFVGLALGCGLIGAVFGFILGITSVGSGVFFGMALVTYPNADEWAMADEPYDALHTDESLVRLSPWHGDRRHRCSEPCSVQVSPKQEQRWQRCS